MVALFSKPIQIWLGLSDRNVRLHRRLGVIYMSAVVTSSVAAYYLAFHTDVAGSSAPDSWASPRHG
jgi:hypothetical protein